MPPKRPLEEVVLRRSTRDRPSKAAKTSHVVSAPQVAKPTKPKPSAKSPEFLVTSARSPLLKVDIHRLLRRPRALHCLQPEQQAQLLIDAGVSAPEARAALLAGPVAAHKALMGQLVGNSALKTDMSEWMHTLRGGFFVKKTWAQMVLASEERVAGVLGEDWEGDAEEELEEAGIGIGEGKDEGEGWWTDVELARSLAMGGDRSTEETAMH